MIVRMILPVLLIFALSFDGTSKDRKSKFDSLLRSAPIVADNIDFGDLPTFTIQKDHHWKYDAFTLQNDASITVFGIFETDELTIEQNSVSSIIASGECLIKGDLILRKNSTLAIEGTVTVLGDLVSDDNAGLIMRAGSLLQVNGNMLGSVSGNIIGSGKVNVKGMVSGSLYNSPMINNLWPYELIHFTSDTQAGTVKLSWATMSEYGQKKFIIQHSSDGLLFEDCTTVEAQGKANALNYYSAVDLAPYPGINFYRLQEINSNNQPQSSNIITSYIIPQLKGLEIISRPITNQIAVFYKDPNKEISIRMLDKAGHVLLSDITYSSFAYTINTSLFDTGVYYLEIAIDGISEQRAVSVIN